MKDRDEPLRTNESWDDDDWLWAIKWAATLIEPLLPPARRERLTTEFRRTAAAHPDRAVLVFAGVVSDLSQSLPAADPWSEVVFDGSVATLDGRPFGTVADHYDLIPKITPDPEIDIALSAVIDAVEPSTAEMIAVSLLGIGALIDWLTQRDPSDRFDVSVDAIRLLTFRRRSLVGVLDAFAVDACWWWGERAYRINIGEADLAEMADLAAARVASDTISDDRYVADDAWVAERSLLRTINDQNGT